MAKGFVRSVVGRCGAVLLIGFVAWCPARAAGPPPATIITLDVVLPAHHLPALTARVMKKETVRIWAGEGVQITWRDSEAEVPPGTRFIRLALIDDSDRPRGKIERFVLGDFLPDEGRVRISLFAASQAAMNSTPALRRIRDPFEYPLALGYILGRAVAHEVGHALLGRVHAEAGLMQSHFNPATMAEAPSNRFHLTAAESARLSRSHFDQRAAGDAAESRSTPVEVASLARVLTR